MDLLQMMLSVRPVHAAVSMPHPAALHRIPARPVHVACVAPTQLPLRPPASSAAPDPTVLPMVRVDRGAIRFLLAGAHMMCPGLTSAGGYLPPAEAALAANTPGAIYAEGKEHAAAIGLTKLSTEDIRKVNKGVGVETVTYLGDDLWRIQQL